jgi:glycosyltransferase involved in cell wall biosynthesis
MNNAQISLLTAGRDRPYALGLAGALAAGGWKFDFIGSDEVDSPELRNHPQVNFLNLRGEQSVNASALKKMARVLVYYFRLLLYALTARPKIFHILWNNKFEFFDRTVLMLFYKLLGKKIVFTVHNVNAAVRDHNDSRWNRATLKFQYRLCDHILVHTEKMKQELISDFNITKSQISVIPFGINQTVPNTKLISESAREKLGLSASEKVILFFGNIAPYKGLEILVNAFANLAAQNDNFRLVIAGRPKGEENYWRELLKKINNSPARLKMILKIEYVPDGETEIYFKAADVLVLPYTHIFQSGVLSLGYNFGLPVIASDVGSLREEIVEGKTGFIFESQSSNDLSRVIQNYFASDLFCELKFRRAAIQNFANERYAWSKVADITATIYSNLLLPIKQPQPRCATQNP